MSVSDRNGHTIVGFWHRKQEKAGVLGVGFRETSYVCTNLHGTEKVHAEPDFMV